MYYDIHRITPPQENELMRTSRTFKVVLQSWAAARVGVFRWYYSASNMIVAAVTTTWLTVTVRKRIVSIVVLPRKSVLLKSMCTIPHTRAPADTQPTTPPPSSSNPLPPFEQRSGYHHEDMFRCRRRRDDGWHCVCPRLWYMVFPRASSPTT